VQAQPSPRTLAMRFVVMYSPAGGLGVLVSFLPQTHFVVIIV